MASLTNAPTFTQTVSCVQTQVTVANTNRDGTTGTYSSVLAVGANGSIITSITFQAIVTTAAGTLRIFYAPDGSTYRLFAEVATQGATVSGTVPGEQHTWNLRDSNGLLIPFKVPAGATFKFCPNNAETWNIVLNREDY